MSLKANVLIITHSFIVSLIKLKASDLNWSASWDLKSLLMKQSTTISISIHTDGKVTEGSFVIIAEVNILEPSRKYAYIILIPLSPTFI